ncbi:MAG TPA: protein translocase subunit SecF [Candidatus Bipolaricaulota bacterium]|nr:protein translocase subunit SecF [Candidatus Bipolaricaulota bacterium]
MKQQIIQKRKIYLSISSVLVLLSILSLIAWGLKPGIDFTGGSLLEARFNGIETPTGQDVRTKLAELNLEGDVIVQQSGDNGLLIRMKVDDEQNHQAVLDKLKESYNVGDSQNVEELRFESIGPSIGAELQKKAVLAVLLVLVAIVLYIAWAFRKVSWPIASWKYGVIAIIALFHDILITLGVFSVLGHFANIEVGLPFVAALLTILGYSVNDTIVVFDRVRENLAKFGKSDFEKLVNDSVNSTFVRSLNTSMTTLLVLLVIFIFGGMSIKYFALALMIGILSGTYSSIFIASPLLVVWQKLMTRRNQ